MTLSTSPYARACSAFMRRSSIPPSGWTTWPAARARNHPGASFQRNLALTPRRVRNEAARPRPGEIVHWLTTHGIDVDRDLR